MYFANSKTMMKVSALTLYPLHINLMNVVESMQVMMCSNGHTMVSFFPVEFMDTTNGTYVENSMLPLLARLKNLTT